MSRPFAFFFIIAVWALIYLPGLGSLEIKGEEGRRILPAVAMLQTGNYLLPQVGSEPYFRKPPLINWLVAASFKIFGARNEWTARVPSVLCVLAVALTFLTVARSRLGENGSIAAALIWMTNFGMIEKGRLIEIEALYVSLGGLAMICWLSWWEARRSRWLTWIVPWIFLGLGLLAKGPLHLFFFYAVVLAVLLQAGKVRELLNGQHLLGILLMLGIFAAWAVPCLLAAQESEVAHIWSRQFSGRLSGEDFHFRGWIMNIPRGLGYFLPWVLLFFLRWKQVRRDLFWGMVFSFLVVSLLPGSLPRYTMPLLIPAVWLTATLLNGDLRWPRVIATLSCLAMLIYGFGMTPYLKRREKVRNIASQINQVIGSSDPLYAIDPDYQPFLFYVRDPIVYLNRTDELPRDAHFVLVQKENEPAVLAQRSPVSVHHFKDYRNKEVTLFELPGNG